MSHVVGLSHVMQHHQVCGVRRVVIHFFNWTAAWYHSLKTVEGLGS
jgi:hypothetical protein